MNLNQIVLMASRGFDDPDLLDYWDLVACKPVRPSDPVDWTKWAVVNALYDSYYAGVSDAHKLEDAERALLGVQQTVQRALDAVRERRG